MGSETQNDGRRADLEVELGFLQRQVEELDEVVTAQADLIDGLRARIDKLEQSARGGDGNQEPLRPHDDPPPHY